MERPCLTFCFRIEYKLDADQQYIKRIIGLPGDRVEIKDDVLYINGKPYEESYEKK